MGSVANLHELSTTICGMILHGPRSSERNCQETTLMWVKMGKTLIMNHSQMVGIHIYIYICIHCFTPIIKHLRLAQHLPIATVRRGPRSTAWWTTKCYPVPIAPARHGSLQSCRVPGGECEKIGSWVYGRINVLRYINIYNLYDYYMTLYDCICIWTQGDDMFRMWYITWV